MASMTVTIFSRRGFIAGVSLLIVMRVSLAQDMSPPSPPTIEGCRTFLQEVYSRKQANWTQVLQCMRQPPHWGYASECQHGRIVSTLQAWSQCERASEICELDAMQQEGEECYKQAQERAQAERKEKEADDAKRKKIDDAVNKANDYEKRIKDARDVYNDPVKFIRNKLSKKLSQNLLESMGVSSGKLTERGESLSRDTYDWLFGHTLGNSSLRSANPIISAIQGSAAEEIKKSFSSTLDQSQKLAEDIGKFSIPGASNAGGNRSPSPASDDCSLLNSSDRTDFAEDHPQEYSALVSRCSR
jgi:hypothetical protein